ncbi:MAG: substrate-binding domain-containing protein [Caldimonas sp.]
MLRRRLLAAGLALAASPAARAQKSAGTGPLRLGIDHALVESGLGLHLQRAFSADTGIAVKLVAGPALAVLEATKEGELDAALTNTPTAEEALAAQTLVHDRRAIAAGAFLLVGPAPRGRGKGAPPIGRGAIEALGRIRDLALAAPEGVVFLSAGDGSGTHVAEQAAWLAAGIAPAAPWYVNAGSAAGFVAKVRARGAYAVVERGAWSVAGGGLSVLVDGDPLLAESVHAMRSFRATHPAGKIFIAWIGGGRGHAVVASHRGYRRPA